MKKLHGDDSWLVLRLSKRVRTSSAMYRGKHSPTRTRPSLFPPASSASGGGRSHHSHGHGHGGHGHKRDLKREQAALIKSQFLPGLPPVVPFPSPAGPAVSGQQAHGAGFVSGVGTSKHQQPTGVTPVTSASSGSMASPVPLWGEVEAGGRSAVGHKQPMRQLLCDGWKVTSVTCSVPRLYRPPDTSTLPFSVGQSTSRWGQRSYHGTSMVVVYIFIHVLILLPVQGY